MSVLPLALAHLVRQCAPHVGPRTMSAIVAYESRWEPYAIGDNTARRSYAFGEANAAVAAATRLLRAGHDIDVGYVQINDANFAAYGLDLRRAFNPCTNIATGARILRRAYATAVRTYGPGQRALAHALSAYNSGDEVAHLAYARRVYALAAAARVAPAGGARKPRP